MNSVKFDFDLSNFICEFDLYCLEEHGLTRSQVMDLNNEQWFKIYNEFNMLKALTE